MTKHYDQAYFDRWYRDGNIGGARRLKRKVALALAMTESILERPVRTILDIGCGEGAWRAPLLKLRPKAHYLGFDSSVYAVQRYGRSRGIHLATFGDFATLRPCAPVDLLVCSDTMHYVPTRELDAGLPGLAELCGGVAFLETFCREDAIEGDHDGFIARPAAFYRKRLDALGFTALGGHCWLAPRLDASGLTALERPLSP
ncbi:class I SAM-dependent DNA methyltransferase [Solilutibacter silvestris]|uniref:Methyltransferase domain n=1 Tax=Solilutibacter silvestris TaxID=1645665 RepID=A0A2K1Q3M4_9GAMM|nr:class I SAM-dependent methyltransferase [Lysobacter silvestris]PNS09646.1 Methyltransferase domain [Lysobacter silvestris]